MTEQRSPRVGDDVEVRIPRARVTQDYPDGWVRLANGSLVRKASCTVLSPPPQPGERIETLARLFECVNGTVFAPDDPLGLVVEKCADGWRFGRDVDSDSLPVLPGRVLAVRGEQR